MKRFAVLATIASVAILFSFGGSIAADQFEGLTMTQPDDSISVDVRAFFGKWIKGSGWDGTWNIGQTNRGVQPPVKNVPGSVAIYELTNEKAKIKILYGKDVFDCTAKVVNGASGPSLQVMEKISPPYDRSGEAPVLTIENGKLIVK